MTENQDRASLGIPVVYGATWCPDCKRAKQFLGDQRVRYQWVDIERDPEAMAYVEQVNSGKWKGGTTTQ